MGRLLDEQMVLARLHKHFANGFDEDRWWNSTHVLMAINETPSVERKGHWQITDAYPHNVYCSECHKRFAQTHWAVWEDGSLPRLYCPNCGARMDGEQ